MTFKESHGLQEKDATMTNEEDKLIMKLMINGPKSKLLLFLLILGLPTSSKTNDAFVMNLLDLPFNFDGGKMLKVYHEDVNGVVAFNTPFKGKQSIWKEKALVFKESGLDVSDSDIELVESVIHNKKEVIVEVDETAKHSIQVHQIPTKIFEFREECLKTNDLKKELLWNYFIIKVLTGSRTEQLASVRTDDVFFTSDKKHICIQYKQSVKGQKEWVIYHTFGRNPSTGVYALYFDIPTLYTRQIEIAKLLCPTEIRPLVFPFWINNGVSILKDKHTINKHLRFRLPYAPHATRDICVMLAAASGLSKEETKKYLTHSEKSNTLAEHYYELADKYLSYPTKEARDEIFGLLTNNIKLEPIVVEKILTEHMETQRDHIKQKGFLLESCEVIKAIEGERNVNEKLIAYLMKPSNLNATLKLASLLKMELGDQEYIVPTVSGFDEAILILNKNDCLEYGMMPLLHYFVDGVKTKAQLEDKIERLEITKSLFG
jgi:hypothetical protein